MSVTWSLNAGQLITRAYRIGGSLSFPWTPDLDQQTQGIIALNAMLKGWMAEGVNLYRQEQSSLTIPAGVGYAGNPFLVSPQVMGIEDARWVVQPAPNLYERPMGIFQYDDYMTLPNKLQATTSGPSIICYDKQTTTSGLYFWPLPTYGGTCNLTVMRIVNDVVNWTDPLDFPVEWTEAAIYGLADRLCDDQGMALADAATTQRIRERSQQLFMKLLDFDRPAAVFMRPWGRPGRGRLYR